MAEKSLTELIREINRLVAQFQTTNDPELKTRSLEDGLSLACLAMKELNQLLKELADTLFSECGLGQEHAKLPFRDVVGGNVEFRPFESPQALRAFLEATKALHVELHLTEDEIEGLHSAVDATYDHFMNGHVSLDRMRDQFKRLEHSFCHPPPEPPPRPGGLPGSIYAPILFAAWKTFNWIGPLIVKAWEEWGSAAGGFAAQLRSPEKRTVALLSVLMLSGLSDKLAKDEDEEEERTREGDVVPA